MDFEAYLISKKIDSALFLKAEADVWNAWKVEFEQLHPNSFTSQKLYLINPVRRKYPLKEVPVKEATVKKEEPVKTEVVNAEVKTDIQQEAGEVRKEDAPAKPVLPKPAVPRPVFKTKPKTT